MGRLRGRSRRHFMKHYRARSVSWAMPPEATLREAREAAAQRLGVHADEMTVLVKKG